MKIIQVTENKRQYLPLLLLADEQENMIDRYLDRGRMYALFDGDLRAVCVVTDEGEGILELKNLAVSPAHQKKGYGRAMLEILQKEYRGKFHTLQLGTGDSPLTVPFYEKCGFARSHVVKNFFTDNYDHPIIECGILLRDMVYFKKEL